MGVSHFESRPIGLETADFVYRLIDIFAAAGFEWLFSMLKDVSETRWERSRNEWTRKRYFLYFFTSAHSSHIVYLLSPLCGTYFLWTQPK